jgi:hypothetical protein
MDNVLALQLLENDTNLDLPCFSWWSTTGV